MVRFPLGTLAAVPRVRLKFSDLVRHGPWFLLFCLPLGLATKAAFPFCFLHEGRMLKAVAHVCAIKPAGCVKALWGENRNRYLNDDGVDDGDGCDWFVMMLMTMDVDHADDVDDADT